MRQYGLIGYPLSHSFSQEYFTEKFNREGIDAIYENFALPTIELFPDLISENAKLVGLNVTIPYKQKVIPYLDALDREAQAIGAVNVIRIERNENVKPRLIGFNSDFLGFLESIRPYVEAMRLSLKESASNLKESGESNVLKALILGTGGASKAIKYGLNQLGVETLFVSRTGGYGRITYQDLSSSIYEEYRIIVNTTPLGMFPAVAGYPPLNYQNIGPKHLLFDLVYNPEKTLFLQKGEEQGATIKNGLEMLHLQAIASWKIWNNGNNY